MIREQFRANLSGPTLPQPHRPQCRTYVGGARGAFLQLTALRILSCRFSPHSSQESKWCKSDIKPLLLPFLPGLTLCTVSEET